MDKLKPKIRGKSEVEQPIGSLSLAFSGNFRTLRISLQRTQSTIPQKIVAQNLKVSF